MTEETNPTPHAETPEEQPTPQEIPEFVRLVMEALESRKIKPKCPSCNCIGWRSFAVHPSPLAQQMFDGQVMFAARFICTKCGAIIDRNVHVLGITITQQQRRVLTPQEVAAQQQRPSLVMP